MRRALAITVALAATAAPAAASERPKTARFKVTVTGVQTTTWEVDHPSGEGCDGAMQGEGTERVTFRSKPVRVTATLLKGLSAPILGGRKPGSEVVAKLRGRVVRDGQLQAERKGDCGGAEDETPVPRDCGTKAMPVVRLPLAYRLAAKPRDQLDLSPGSVESPFANCPAGGYSFPTLVTTRGGEYARTELPRSELFDRSLGKIIVVVEGNESDTVSESTFLTRSRWEVTFLRL